MVAFMSSPLCVRVSLVSSAHGMYLLRQVCCPASCQSSTTEFKHPIYTGTCDCNVRSMFLQASQESEIAAGRLRDAEAAADALQAQLKEFQEARQETAKTEQAPALISAEDADCECCFLFGHSSTHSHTRLFDCLFIHLFSGGSGGAASTPDIVFWLTAMCASDAGLTRTLLWQHNEPSRRFQVCMMCIPCQLLSLHKLELGRHQFLIQWH